MYASEISKLDHNEKIVLYACAILGVWHLANNLGVLNRNFNIATKEVTKIQTSLQKKKFLKSDYYYSYASSISDEARAKVVAYMLKNDYGIYRNMREALKMSAESKNFCELIEYAMYPEKARRPKAFFTEEIFRYLYPVADEEWLPRALSCLNDGSHISFVHNILNVWFANDEPLSKDKLDGICSVGAGASPYLKGNLEDLHALYAYYAWGEFEAPLLPSPQRPYQMLLHGIRQCQLGNYAEARTLFQAAAKTFNKDQDIKNVFFDTMGQYYLILTYAHIGTSETQTKMGQFLRKKDIWNYYQLRPAYALAQAFTSSNHEADLYTIESMVNLMVNGKVTKNYSFIAWFFVKYFGLVSEKASYSTALPSYAILKYEAMKYLGLPEAEQAELTSKYGPCPALTTIPRKAAWEWAIDDILRSVEEQAASQTTAGSAQSKERIVYVVGKRELALEPVLQTVLKSGTWSKPKAVSKRRFEDMEIECMNDTDRSIAGVMSKLNPYFGYPQFPPFLNVAHLLIGSDRVFVKTLDGNLGSPIEILEAKPCVNLKRTGDKIQITANFTLKDLPYDFNGGFLTLKRSETLYEAMRITPPQLSIIKQLLMLKEFPAEAEQQVQQFLTRLEEVVDVNSPLLDTKAIPNLDGGRLLVVKAMPAGGMTYDINVWAHPVPEGQAYALPGVGRGVIYDTIEGKNVRVKRDLAGEADAYRDFSDFLEGVGIALSDDFMGNVSVEGLLAIMDYAKEEKDAVAIEWPQGKKLTLKHATAGSTWNVGIKSDNGWFDIEGDVRIDGDTVLSMTALLDLLGQSKGRFIRLNDQDFIEIDKKLRKQLERLEALAVKNRNKLQISSFNAALLDDAALNGEIKFRFDSKLRELQKRIKDSREYTPEVPATLNATLRPYQLEGFQWMARLASWGAGACLADDMGLGKTVQTIAFLLHKASEGPALVVAPASVIPNWEAELEKFAPTLAATVLNKAEDRKAAIEGAGPYSVILTTYGLLNTEEEDLAKKKFATICLDEAHTIKNRETKMSHAAMQLQADYRIILTGTPIQNHLGELWNLFRFINPGLLGGFDTFRQKFVNPITLDNDKERRKALQRIIKPFMLRRTKAEVIDDLPDKTEIVLPVELSDGEMAMYEAMRIKTAEALASAEKVDVNTLAEITKLRRAACSMTLVNSDWGGANSKVQAFLDLVEDFKGDNNRMLVFSQFTSFLEIVRQVLDAAGEKYLYLDGSTTMKQREKLVEEFRQGKCPLFLISLKAGGLGLNLPEANYVVHLDPWWNPAIEQQATDRAYRIGQNRNVTVYHLVAKNTIEEKIRRLHRTKRDLADSLLEGTDMAGKLSMKDVIELLKQ